VDFAGRGGDIILGGPFIIAFGAVPVLLEVYLVDGTLFLVLNEAEFGDGFAGDGVDTLDADDNGDMVLVVLVVGEVEPHAFSSF